MKIYGLTVFWQEPPEMLARSLKSLRDCGCDVIVSLDGKFKGYEGPECSSAETVAVANNLSDIFIPGRLWERQEEKRTAALDIVPAGEWFFILDADEVAEGKFDKERMLKRDCWSVPVQDIGGARNNYNRLFTKIPGMIYARKHSAIYIKEQMKDNDLYAGLVSLVKNRPCLPGITIMHHRLERDEERKKNRANYALAKLKIEAAIERKNK